MDSNYDSDAHTVSDDDWAEYQRSESGSPKQDSQGRLGDGYEEEQGKDSDDENWKSASISSKRINPCDMIDPSQYRQIAFVVRSDLSKKFKSIAELQTASQTLRKVWKPYLFPIDQQCMKHKSTNYVDVHLYRHDRTSLMHVGTDPGFVQLQKVLGYEDSALVISGLDGLTADSAALSEYLSTFNENTMLYFFSDGSLQWKFKSKDLANHLVSVAPRAKGLTARDDVRSLLKLIKWSEDSREKGWALLRLVDSVDTYNDDGEPRQVTPRMIKVLETITQKDLAPTPRAVATFSTKLQAARQELAQAIEEKIEAKALLYMRASKSQKKDVVLDDASSKVALTP